jgi:signal transduction histidine kinase
MKLGLKIGLVYLMVAGLFLEAAVIAHMVLENISLEARTATQEDEQMMRRLAEARHDFELAWKESRLALASAHPMPDATTSRADLARLLDEIRGRARPEERAVADALAASWARISDAFDRMAGQPSRAERAFNREIQPALEPFRALLDQLHGLRSRAYEERIGRIQKKADEARTQLATLALLVMIAGLVLFLVIRLQILSPLYQLKIATKGIAAGNLSHRVAEGSRDEFGDLARDFNRMAKKLADAERMKMEFLSMISHEMRTPLTAMGGYATLLRKGRHGPINEKQAASLDIIRQETGRLHYLVDDLLEAARAEAGSFRIEPAPCEVGHILDSLMHTFERQAEEKKIALKHDVKNLPQAIVDGRRLGQALRNLVTNALKFTPVGGRITVHGQSDGREMLLEVSDTGLGIPPEKLDHIFDRFYQTRPEKDARAGGVGLGLAIVREIVQAHGGRVEVQSELEKGTTFRLRVPIKTPLAPPQSQPSKTAASGDGAEAS